MEHVLPYFLAIVVFATVVYLATLRDQGLIALDIVFAVVTMGVLAAVAVQSYGYALPRAYFTAAMPIATHWRTNIAVEHAVTGRWPQGTVPSAHTGLDGKLRSGSYRDGAIQAVFSSEAGELGGKRLSLRTATVAGDRGSPIALICGYAEPPKGMATRGAQRTTVPPYLLPASCRSQSE